MLKQRIITGLILAPIAIGGIFFLPPFEFSLFIGFVIAVGGWEWANLAGFSKQIERVAFAAFIALLLYLSTLLSSTAVLGASVLGWVAALYLITQYPGKKLLWECRFRRLLMGVFVLVPAWVGLVAIRETDVLAYNGQLVDVRYLIIYIMFIVWGADVGAYFAGKTWGNKKLAPNVSPGKSWAGVYGGLATTVLFAVIASVMLAMPIVDTLLLIVITLITAIFSVVGDLFESMLKRHRGIKDSSQLLPGHGGVLDRVDSLTAAVPVLTFLLILAGWF
ncbi:phosphatidate cytidylyltransferase [Alkalimarinus alittae]|uniref:Phosphatidate cytidylyltransferase n=1 Tax=Alkalimarinus alittae TaxID=2961619 RepID=A0ABY6MZ52_9ALTE|nr:phosphatidate cytidylyltransferase [Alkalimarinus alittae]UZE95085.1 phosphatidate cytidylyltransferase [Alkalimarinus alittae]